MYTSERLKTIYTSILKASDKTISYQLDVYTAFSYTICISMAVAALCPVSWNDPLDLVLHSLLSSSCTSSTRKFFSLLFV